MPGGEARYGPHPEAPAFPRQRRIPQFRPGVRFPKTFHPHRNRIPAHSALAAPEAPAFPRQRRTLNSARASILRNPMVAHTASGSPATGTRHTAHDTRHPAPTTRHTQSPLCGPGNTPPAHAHPKTTKGSRLSDCLPIGYLFRRIRERSRGAGARSSGYRPCSCA